MSEQYLGELRLVAFTFAPKGWSLCNGAILPISQNQALFALLGTTYGGNGQNTYGLPNLQGRAPLYVGPGIIQGQSAGEYSHTLSVAEMPLHTHSLNGQNSAADTNNSATLLANTSGATLAIYGPAASLTGMNPLGIHTTGSSQPHPNQSPYLVMTWVIALQGIFPSRN